MLREISKICSTPITFGGGIKDLKTAREIIKSGAEKIYINRKILEDLSFAKILVKEFGGQAVVVGINIIKIITNMKYMKIIRLVFLNMLKRFKIWELAK